jgi:hypothetical protein
MLSIFLRIDPNTKAKNLVKFQNDDVREGIFYLPRAQWEVLGRPRGVMLEVIPDDEEDDVA